MQLRVARHTERLDEVVAFYRDGIGLAEAGGFRGHGGTRIRELFIPAGLLIKNSGAAPEICSVHEFITPRQALVDSDALTAFEEVEIAPITEAFGNVPTARAPTRSAASRMGCPSNQRGHPHPVHRHVRRLEDDCHGVG